MSTWRMVGTGDCSGTEGQPAEPLGVADAGPPALLGGPPAHRLAGPPALTGELGPVTLDGGRLDLDRLGDVDPHVGLERSDSSTVDTWWAGPASGK